MDRSWILVVGMVCAVPLGAAVAIGFDSRPTFVEQPAPTEGQLAEVQLVHVIDGDTIIVSRDEQEERVRILGVDAPEVARDGEPGERCAGEATALTEELASSGSDVVIVLDPSQPQTDRYGRTLAYVDVDGTDVGAELLAAGLAEVYVSAPEIARFADYQAIAGSAEAPDCQ